MRNDEEALVAAIFDNPTDEMARLILADWLEERGDARVDGIRSWIAFQEQTRNSVKWSKAAERIEVMPIVRQVTTERKEQWRLGCLQVYRLAQQKHPLLWDNVVEWPDECDAQRAKVVLERGFVNVEMVSLQLGTEKQLADAVSELNSVLYALGDRYWTHGAHNQPETLELWQIREAFRTARVLGQPVEHPTDAAANAEWALTRIGWVSAWQMRATGKGDRATRTKSKVWHLATHVFEQLNE